MGDGAKGRVVKGYFHREDAKRTEENRWFSDDVVGARRPHLPAPLSIHGEREQRGVFGFWWACCGRGRVLARTEIFFTGSRLLQALFLAALELVD